MKPILATSYVDPDLDGVAGMFAYAEFLNKTGRPAVPGFFGNPHPEARYVLERFGITAPTKLTDTKDFDEVVLLDCGWMQPELIPILAPEKVIEVIDHHAGNDATVFTNAKIQEEFVGAADTLVAERFRNENISISKESAILLYAGIISNTLNFRFKNTSDRDKDAAAWLNQIANLPPEFAHEMFAAKSDLAGPKLAETLETDFANWQSTKVGMAQLEITGGKQLIAERSPEIISQLTALKERNKLSFIFLSIAELDSGTTIFLAPEEATRELLRDVVPGLVFEGNLAVLDCLMLRKELLVPINKKLLPKP